MLLKVALRAITLVGLLVGITACNQKSNSTETRRLLPGTWELKIGHSCASYPIRSDTLILHSDGTFEQHSVTKDGKQIDSMGQHWAYLGDNKLSLDKRRDWDAHSDPALTGAHQVGVNSNDPNGIVELQVLIVQFGSPSVILINPDSDCVYAKTK